MAKQFKNLMGRISNSASQAGILAYRNAMKDIYDTIKKEDEFYSKNMVTS